MSEKKMLSTADLEAQAVVALPDRVLLRPYSRVNVVVIVQVQINTCFFCVQYNSARVS
jgi:hypothetical protein